MQISELDVRLKRSRSTLRAGHPRFIYKAAEFVEHLVCVGLPIGLSVRH